MSSTSVPDDAAKVATAIANINTRTGATGKDLESLTTQFLNLSRVTGENVQSSIAAVTRVFGDWSIATEDQSGAMDFLFKTSQTTGIGVGKLSSLIVQFGAPLRQLGFDFEESAALMGKFEQEGVNTETVMGGLRIGLANLADAGVDGKEGLTAAIDGIQSAGSAAEANALAIEIFGKRAGPDMAAAIREGRFELDGLLDRLSSSTETINGAAEDVEDFGEKWGELTNSVKVAAAPAGRRKKPGYSTPPWTTLRVRSTGSLRPASPPSAMLWTPASSRSTISRIRCWGS